MTYADSSGKMTRLGIFGGAFNPIHFGHLRAAEEVRYMMGLEKVIFIPSGNPPLKTSDLASAHDRYEMTRQATETNPFFVISDIECRKYEKSYTVETLIDLRKVYKDEEFHLMLGIDSFLEMPSWHQPERIVELANLIVISRPGYKFSDISSRTSIDKSLLAALDEQRIQVHEADSQGNSRLFLVNIAHMNISATEIRKCVKDKISIKYLLPETVESYIISNKLYKGDRYR